MDKEQTQRLEMPGFVLERLQERRGKVCELQLCIPAGEATHRALFPYGVEVLLCERHAEGIVTLAEYLKNAPVVMEPDVFLMFAQKIYSRSRAR